MNDENFEISDSGLRTAQALFDLQTLVADQQKLIDTLVHGYRSHHAAVLAHVEQIDDLRHRVEMVEADHG